jgi:predicted translin family RNA/ssDNA-binding protein
VRQLNCPLPDNIAKDIANRLAAIDALFHSLSEDLCGMRAWRYHSQISPGIQEYIEAISFQRYLQNQMLISLEEASTLIVGGVQLTEGDYIMGIFDLVGELMRFGITVMATSGILPGEHVPEDPDDAAQAPNILTDLRSLRTYFEALNKTPSGYFARDFVRKAEVMRKCVEKVESAVYGIIVRGQERPKGWIPDLSDTAVQRLGHDIAMD